MQRMYITCKSKKNMFPKNFRDLFKLSGLTNEEISQKCDISFSHLRCLLYHLYNRMSSKEFNSISFFCKKIEKENLK